MIEVVNVLARLQSKGLFASQVDKWANKIRNMDDSFYAQVKAKRSKTAAEETLEQVIADRHLREFAGSLESIGWGVQALAENGYRVKLIKDPSQISYPVRYNFREHYSVYSMIVMQNPEQPGCGCSQVPATEVWGQHGTLGFKALTICFNEALGQLCINLLFPLPARRSQWLDEGDSMGVDGYTIVNVDTDGHIGGQEVVIRLRRDAYCLSSLGLMDPTNLFSRTMVQGGDLEQRVGFPGAEDYLAKHICSLGTYLALLATKMAAHEHK